MSISFTVPMIKPNYPALLSNVSLPPSFKELFPFCLSMLLGNEDGDFFNPRTVYPPPRSYHPKPYCPGCGRTDVSLIAANDLANHGEFIKDLPHGEYQFIRRRQLYHTERVSLLFCRSLFCFLFNARR